MTYYDQNDVMVRRAVHADIEDLAENLREDDIKEIWASNQHTPHEALKICVEDSMFAMTIDRNKRPIAMFGINPTSIWNKEAIIWLLSTPELYKLKIRFLKNCKKFINLFLEHYPLLYNYVDCRNKESIKWLKFCGASFGAEVLFSGLPFRYFKFEKNNEQRI